MLDEVSQQTIDQGILAMADDRYANASADHC
jgi:hypothetical protein